MTVYLFPGQGSQKVGMGGELFRRFADLTSKADAILGYSIEDQCLKDPQGRLGQTQFTQPALFVVNALSYHLKLEETQGVKPQYVAGHSLGEYSALYAAGVFDFETGLKLVIKRGALMSGVTGGAMAAIIGKKADELQSLLKSSQLTAVDIANLNTYLQIVISGPREEILRAEKPLKDAGAMFFPLNVSGAFHSRYMTPVAEEFGRFLESFVFQAPQIPVIANLTARPYELADIKRNLVDQMNHSVRWCESIEYLLGRGESDFLEVGPGAVLKGMMNKIKAKQ